MKDSKDRFQGCRVVSGHFEDPELAEKSCIVMDKLDKGEDVDSELEGVEEAMLPIHGALDRWRNKR